MLDDSSLSLSLVLSLRELVIARISRLFHALKNKKKKKKNSIKLERSVNQKIICA